jgi:hypothetical protein
MHGFTFFDQAHADYNCSNLAKDREPMMLLEREGQ